MKSFKLIIASVLVMVTGAACSGGGETNSNNATAQNAATPSKTDAAPAATPSNAITEADVAKLKWLEGTWRGMGGEKPFYERIRFEGSTMIVENFADGTLAEMKDTARFELKDGEFGRTVGDQRSAASSITDDSVQFVPGKAAGAAEPKGSTFRFERQKDGSWNTILDSPASGSRPATQKVYRMTAWTASSK